MGQLRRYRVSEGRGRQHGMRGRKGIRVRSLLFISFMADDLKLWMMIMISACLCVFVNYSDIGNGCDDGCIDINIDNINGTFCYDYCYNRVWS